MAMAKQRTAARRNIKKAAAAAKRRRTIAHLPKRTRTALGKQGAKWPAENAGRPDSGDEPCGVLFAPHGDIENGALAVDQEQGEIARFHRVGKALKCRKVGDGLAV